MKKIVLYIALFVIAQSVGFAQQAPQIDKTPKVVLGIVVENMRPDYLQRYWNKFQQNGFKKLYTNGAVCSNVHLSQHVQNYATGTATLFTGVNPSIHGIVDKTWYERLSKDEVDCTQDDFVLTLGSDSKQGNASPNKLFSNTITDILKIYTQGKAKVFSVALNRESAIFSAGHAADGSFWFDVETGRMVTSSYFMNDFPDWVRIFNSENYAEMYSYRNWTTLLPQKDYTESLPDDYILEAGFFDSFNTYPHTVSKYVNKTNNFKPFKATPSANLMIKDFTLKMLENEEIGTDNIPDFVTTVFSSMDYANGLFGPVSMEMEDTYLYLDQYIGELIDFAEDKFGKDNVVIFLTANTSASYPVNYLKEEFHLPVDNFNIERAIALLTTYINFKFGENKWIEHYSDQQIYLDHDLIKKNKIDLNVMRDEISNFINDFEGVQLALPAHQLEQGSSANGLLSLLYKSYAKNRSGDVLFILKEGWQPWYKFKKINYTDQSHIPLIFYGKNIATKKITQKHNAIDFAPTMSELLNIPIPDKSQGNIIDEVVR